MPHVNTVRKQICDGVEVITSGEVSEWMKETVSNNVKVRNRQKKTTKKKEESSDSEQLKPDQ